MLLVVGTGALYVGQGGLGDVSLCGSSSTPTLLSDGWNIRRPWHAEWLKSDLLLLGEEDKVCTRTTTGEIEWQVKASTIGVSPDTPDPVCQHRYPFRVYYSLNAQHQDVRAIQRERGTGTAEDSNFWEFGLDGTRELLPCEKQQKIGGHDVAKRLEDGNWLSVARYGEAAEIDGRTGAVGRSFLFNGIQRSCVVTMLPLPYGDFLVANNHELSVKQITLNGKEVWSYSPLKTDPLGVLRISARLRNGNTLLQTQGHRITEVTPDGREVWEAFVDKDFVVCCSRCLSLVSFGFPSRPKKLNVGDLDHLREGLKSASPMRRQHCRNVVFKMGDKGLEALPEILGNLLVDEPNCAQEFLKDHPDEAAKSLIPWIDASDARKRSVAIGVLGGLGCEPQGAFPKILARLKDRDGEVRLRAINAVSSFKSQAKSAVPALLELATNDQNELNMRCAAIESIGDFGDAARPAIPALLRLADVEDLEIRRAAIKSLGCSRISEKRVVDALAHALEREDTYQMKRTVCHAIKNHGPDASGAVPALIKVCGLCDLPKTDDLDLQALLEDAADALGAMSSKASDAVPALLKIALNRDLPSRTRAAATEAICGTGKAAKPYAAALRSALTNTDDEIVRRRLADLLDNLSRDE
jgi:HEAT repeat protein